MRNAIRIGVITIVFAVLIVGFYYYLSHMRGGKEESPAKQSELEKVLEANFIKNYPETPREVIKWYQRIQKLYYDSETPGGSIESLCDQAMMLFDADLVQLNPRDSYITSVKADIEDFANHKKRLIKAEVCDSNDIIYKDKGKERLAYVQTEYFLAENSDYQTTYQKYCLRKDGDGHWRIVAFEKTDEDGNAL